MKKVCTIPLGNHTNNAFSNYFVISIHLSVLNIPFPFICLWYSNLDSPVCFGLYAFILALFHKQYTAGYFNPYRYKFTAFCNDLSSKMYTPLLENPTDPAKRDIPWNKFKQLYLDLLVLLLIIHKTHFLSSRKVHIIERVVTLSCKTRHVVENENVLEGRFKDLVKSPEK